MKWFEVDKEGLSALLERRGKQFIIYELVQNAWDENTSKVAVWAVREGGKVTITVEDDNPEGFKNLSHAFTLFAESAKKADPEKRGRFNLGEKLVLALCKSASIETTTGTVIFDAKGRHSSRKTRDRGSKFTGVINMTADEFRQLCDAVHLLIPPASIVTTFNGNIIGRRQCLKGMVASLPTEIADPFGVLRRTARQTIVQVYEPANDEPAMIYEMGIPVVETGDRWHVNIGQKVPLNMDRDNVTPSYLGEVRACVAEMMRDYIGAEDANSTWVRDAVSRHGEEMSPDLIEHIVTQRFGEKRVAYDPSDPEANALAVTKGYAVVHGSQLGKAEWQAARRIGAILPAGQVTPSPKPFSPDGRPLRLLDEKAWTPGVAWFYSLARKLAVRLLDTGIEVILANDPGWKFLGAYGARELYVNVHRAGGVEWFDGPLAPIFDFLIHEFAHHHCGNHLDERYHEALTMLGGKLAQLCLEEPKLFQRKYRATAEQVPA